MICGVSELKMLCKILGVMLHTISFAKMKMFGLKIQAFYSFAYLHIFGRALLSKYAPGGQRQLVGVSSLFLPYETW